MIDPGRQSLDIGRLLARFPCDAALVARLVGEDDAFRSLCEDFVLAETALVQFEALQREQETTKIAEYRQLVAELENDIAEALQHAKRSQ